MFEKEKETKTQRSPPRRVGAAGSAHHPEGWEPQGSAHHPEGWEQQGSAHHPEGWEQQGSAHHPEGWEPQERKVKLF